MGLFNIKISGFISVCFVVVGGGVSLCSPSWPGTHYVGQDDLEYLSF